MIGLPVDDWADEGGHRYRRFCDHLIMLYQRTMTAAAGLSAPAISATRAEARQLGAEFLNAELERIDEILADVSQNARESVGSAVADTDAETQRSLSGRALRASREYLIEELSAQVSRDIARLKNELHASWIEVSAAARSSNRSERQAIIEHLLSRNGPTFLFRNRGGHLVEANRFARLVWRQAIVSTFNETVLLLLAEAGQTAADVLKRDAEGAIVRVMRISITGRDGGLSYADVRAGTFHPNTAAWLAAAREAA